jgi:hypothetical protein
LIELLGRVKYDDPMIQIPREMLVLAEVARTDMDHAIEELVETTERTDDDTVLGRPPTELDVDKFKVEQEPVPLLSNQALLKAFIKRYSMMALIAGITADKNSKSKLCKSLTPSEFQSPLKVKERVDAIGIT